MITDKDKVQQSFMWLNNQTMQSTGILYILHMLVCHSQSASYQGSMMSEARKRWGMELCPPHRGTKF